ncbi:MAG: helix-turn-helix transcriptional regulator [Lachnospiraceae bacterium]|nr:helix-turn-helix transcriptional regulator [Lachnospiraceae bacterium]MBR1817195.1 helix-turn-helix transcriptional regulator [Lachnospiraceae bacterium]
MGYGKNLEKAIKEKGWSVAETARRTNVNVNTIHGIIRRDSPVRYDHALRLSNVLGIDIKEICKENPYDDGDVLPALLPDGRGAFTKLDKSAYIKHRLNSILDIYKYSDYPIIDQLITNFYMMDDAGRKQFIDYANFILQTNTDKDRANEVKQIE